mgnify:CR=1 FL=1
MYQRKPRRFRHRSNGRNHQMRNQENAPLRLGSSLFSNDRLKNNFNIQQSAEKLAEKYNILAKEALTSGDKILSENYFQHADHFMRIVDEKSLNQNKNKIQVSNKPGVSDRLSAENNKTNQHRSIEDNKE